MLVRGLDEKGGWYNFAGPRGLFNREDLNIYNYVLNHQSKVLMEGANLNEDQVSQILDFLKIIL